MRLVRLLIVSLALASQGCLTVSGLSYSNVAPVRRPPVSATDWTLGALHLTDPPIEDVVTRLTGQLATQCGGDLANVQTVLKMRQYLVVQIYSVRLTAECTGPSGRSSARM